MFFIATRAVTWLLAKECLILEERKDRKMAKISAGETGREVVKIHRTLELVTKWAVTVPNRSSFLGAL
jgi:hypothetical protein